MVPAATQHNKTLAIVLPVAIIIRRRREENGKNNYFCSQEKKKSVLFRAGVQKGRFLRESSQNACR